MISVIRKGRTIITAPKMTISRVTKVVPRHFSFAGGVIFLGPPGRWRP